MLVSPSLTTYRVHTYWRAVEAHVSMPMLGAHGLRPTFLPNLPSLFDRWPFPLLFWWPFPWHFFARTFTCLRGRSAITGGLPGVMELAHLIFCFKDSTMEVNRRRCQATCQWVPHTGYLCDTRTGCWRETCCQIHVHACLQSKLCILPILNRILVIMPGCL